MIRFALPAAGAAILGGILLRYCAALPVVATYELRNVGGSPLKILRVKPG